jgi:hypothetical protein
MIHPRRDADGDLVNGEWREAAWRTQFMNQCHHGQDR